MRKRRRKETFWQEKDGDKNKNEHARTLDLYFYVRQKSLDGVIG